jgi:cyclic beta-1,2-glucan synthetase
LSNTAGCVLDPVFSVRRRVRLAPGGTARVAFWTLVAGSRAEALDLVDKHHEPAAFERVMTLAWTQSQILLDHLQVGAEQAHLFQRLANHVLFTDPTLRPTAEMMRRTEGGVGALWTHGISGDLPIVLVRVDEPEDLETVRQLTRAHEFWRTRRLAADLVILNERKTSYVQDLQQSLEALARAGQALPRSAPQGGVFVLRGDLIAADARAVLHRTARVVFVARRGSLAEQLERAEAAEMRTAQAPVLRRGRRSLLQLLRGGRADEPRATGGPFAAAPRPETEFFNGLGGFGADGREYVVTLGPDQWTPAPWIDVVANASFGFHASAEGGCSTWSVNSRERQLTPWSNDPVSDPPGEAFFVRDDDTGAVWTPTALPVRESDAPYVCRHGQGYVKYEHASHEIALELLQFVANDDPVKISRLRLTNRSGRSRRLSVTFYAEWVLGQSRGKSAPFLATESDATTNALFVRNPWSVDFGQRVAFADLDGAQVSWTGDRTEFLGRNGSLERPAAVVEGRPLSKRVGSGLDPCAALQTRVNLAAGETAEVVCFLGDAENAPSARGLVERYRRADLDVVFRDVVRRWDDVLGAVQVRTPDRATDLMLNRWLLYQTLCCRIWARSGFYQASGAYGFRDQLQDVMALLLAKPAIAREHLIRTAARQFREGDVQHWWLPHSGQGVRTRISDDLLWLPYLLDHYAITTGDDSIFDAAAPFLEGPPLKPEEHDAFNRPATSEETASLYEHGARAIDRSLAVGPHGLPLIGDGDWNDGMNRVGRLGRGESTWLGWFLHATIEAYAPRAEARGETARATEWRAHAVRLKAALEAEGWDGAWYRRGFFDDGTPFGSAANEECRIDSIAQTWAVISGAADPERAGRAMDAVYERLVGKDDRLVRLFTPPYDKSRLDPGYVKGYPPGVRENGGQYTHAATWVVIAEAMRGDGDRAAELFGMMNPVNHASTRAATHRYKVEPYVICADVYSAPPHVGRGGWTWYTGSAGWMYRAGVERILGVRRRGPALIVDPCIPKAWRGFEVTFRFGSTKYEIAVVNPKSVCRGVATCEADGATTNGSPAVIPLVDDGHVHQVRVTLG